MNMNKPVFGLLLGGALGILDGLTAWFTPEVRAGLLGIVIGSCFKGLVAGVMIGFFAKKVQSRWLVASFGLIGGMFLAFLAANMQGKDYFDIMWSGGLVGAITGFATQKYVPAQRQSA